MKSASSLTDDELRVELTSIGRNVGPITATTRSVYERLLEKSRSEKTKKKEKPDALRKSNATQDSDTSAINKSVEATSVARRTESKASESEENFEEADVYTRSNAKRLVITSAMNSTKTKAPKMKSPSVTYRTPTTRAETVRVIEKNIAPVVATGSRPSVAAATKPGLFSDLTESYIGRFSNSSTTTPAKIDSVDAIRVRSYEEQEDERDVDTDCSDDHMESSRYLSSQHTPPVFEKSRVATKTNTISKSFLFNDSPYADTFKPSTRPSQGLSSFNAVRGDLMRARHGKQNTMDASKIILYSFVFLFAFLAIAYSSIVHSQLLIDGSKLVVFSMKDGVAFLYNYAVLPIIGAAFVVGIIALVYFFTQRRLAIAKREKMQLFDLIEQIIDIIREASEKGQVYIAEPHVRDMLIPPLKRSPESAEWIRWQEAVKFINLNESRVCTETRIVSGVECCVWRWVPAKKTGWQGNAFEKQFSIPEEALTRCLKIRGMFPSKKPGSDGEDVAVSLSQKISPVRPAHLHVVNDSKEGVVFAKFATLPDCKHAYDALHGTWFNGQLVSVKFLREERYAEHFSETRRY